MEHWEAYRVFRKWQHSQSLAFKARIAARDMGRWDSDRVAAVQSIAALRDGTLDVRDLQSYAL